MPNQTLLEHANDLIYGDRAAVYGPYDEEAQKLALAFSIVLGFRVPPEKVPLLMVALKMVRLSNTPTHTDSWVDIAGYAGCAGKLPTIWPVKEDNDAGTGESDSGAGEPKPVGDIENVFSLRPEDT